MHLATELSEHRDNPFGVPCVKVFCVLPPKAAAYPNSGTKGGFFFIPAAKFVHLNRRITLSPASLEGMMNELYALAVIVTAPWLSASDNG
jgi:hypothetical protein